MDLFGMVQTSADLGTSRVHGAYVEEATAGGEPRSSQRICRSELRR